LAGRVPLKIAYLLMRWLFRLVVLVFRGDRAKDAELLVLRHENAVLRRTAGQVRYELWVPRIPSRAMSSRVACQQPGRDDHRSCACGSCAPRGAAVSDGGERPSISSPSQR
jgi:hypothetical protein